jgi:dynein heavy chain
MDMAKKLINSLGDEKERWNDDSQQFADLKRRLIGDVAVATAFVSYCGPFNSEYRNLLMKDYFINDLKSNDVPVTVNLELTKFLVDESVVGEWNLQGLPKDDLSTQNAIMVTTSQRYPLMIDPQGQAVKWITSKEAENLMRTNQNHKNFKDDVRFCIDEGKPLLVEGIENEVDPGMDPVLEK